MLIPCIAAGGGVPALTLLIRSGCRGGGKGALIQKNKSATLATHNTQTLFVPVALEERKVKPIEVIPIADKATRYKGGGNTRKEDGAGNGLGIGEADAPAYTLTAADRHAVAYSLDKAAYNQGEMHNTELEWRKMWLTRLPQDGSHRQCPVLCPTRQER